MKKCSIEGCDNHYVAKGYCHKHYKRYKTHGDPLISKTPRHGMRSKGSYKTWNGMIQRCYNKNSVNYKYYGGRGITVCNRWINSFINFYEDMGERPEGMSLDRIDNNKVYSKNNCKWVDKVSQGRNRRVMKNNTSGHKGVYWNKKSKKYQASISVDKKLKHLGLFNTINEAIDARKKAEKKYWY